jgi:hypothetical protein
MLGRIFPRTIDNRFRGHVAALWIFVPIVIMRLGIAIGSLLRADGSLQSADGIPLDTYPPAAAKAIIGVSAYGDVADLWLALVFVLALVRYRAMVPLMFLVVVADWFAHKGVGIFRPIARMAGTSTGTYVTLAIFGLSVLGFVLSGTGKGYLALSSPSGGSTGEAGDGGSSLA